MSNEARVLVNAGTRIAAFIFEGDRARYNWLVHAPHFAAWSMQYMKYDARSGFSTPLWIMPISAAMFTARPILVGTGRWSARLNFQMGTNALSNESGTAIPDTTTSQDSFRPESILEPSSVQKTMAKLGVRLTV